MLVDWSKLYSMAVQESFDFICDKIKTCTKQSGYNSHKLCSITS